MPDDSTTPKGVNGDPGKQDANASTGADDTQVIKAQKDESDATSAKATESASDETRSEKLEKNNRRFSRWRKQRPFAAGLLMILAGIVIMVPTYLSLSIDNIQIQISSLGGVSTLVIGILLITCGIMTWFRGEGRILAGVAALILSVLALWQSNFGGFGVGLILGLIGGALALAWDPQPKDEYKAEKKAKKKAKKDKKARKRAKREKKAAKKNSAKSVIAVVAALTVGIGIQSPPARAQLPGVEDLQLPELNIPQAPGQDDGTGEDGETDGQGNGNGDGNSDGNGNGDSGNRPNTPRLPNIPTPDLPDLPDAPDLPDPPNIEGPDGNELQGSLDDLGIDIPGLNVAPPAPVEGMRTPTGNTFTIQSDTTAMTPNMKMSFVTIDTQQGPKKALRIDSDQTLLDNLKVQFPNSQGGADLMQDTMGGHSTLTGNFHIFVEKVTMTLELLGQNTQIPITIDANWPPDQISAELEKIGLGLPDLLSGETKILDGRMETFLVMADKMEFPTNKIKNWEDTGPYHAVD